MELEVQKYEHNLREIRRRTDVIHTYLLGQKSTGNLTVEVEFLAIQFRKVIELIAFSSMTLNKEEYSRVRFSLNKDFRNDWNVKRVFEMLEKVNPYFYPEPSTPIEKSNKDGKQIIVLEKISSGYLTKEDAIEVYNDCSNVLREWNPYAEEADIIDIHENFKEWGNRLVMLLNHHTIVLSHKGLIVAAEMNSKSTGQPKVSVFGQLKDIDIKNLEKNLKSDLRELGFWRS